MYEILIFVAIQCLAILVGSVMGFGGGLTAIPLMALFFEPRLVVPAFSLVALVINAILVVESRQHLRWSRVKYLIAGGVVGIPIGAFALAYFPADIIKVVISVATLIFALLFLLKVTIPVRTNRLVQSAVGILSGILGGGIAQAGPPVVIYGLGLNWAKNVFRTTLLTYFLALAVIANINYLWLGLFGRVNLRFALWAVIPAVLASQVGIKIKNKIPENSFRTIALFVLIAVALLGIAQLLRR